MYYLKFNSTFQKDMLFHDEELGVSWKVWPDYRNLKFQSSYGHIVLSLPVNFKNLGEVDLNIVATTFVTTHMFCEAVTDQ